MRADHYVQAGDCRSLFGLPSPVDLMGPSCRRPPQVAP